MSYKVISGGRRKKDKSHKCQLPGFFATVFYTFGTVVECTECEKQYKKEFISDWDCCDVYWEEVIS